MPHLLNSIYKQVSLHAQETPAKTAVIYDQHKISYEELKQKIDFWHRDLSQQNYQSVGYFLTDKLTLISFFIAASNLNINSLIFNPAWPQQQKQKIYDQLKPDALIFDHPHDLNIPQSHSLIKEGCISISHIKETPLLFPSQNPHSFYTGFTSGSTGGPKGFMRSEQSWLESFISEQKRFNLNAKDIFISPGYLAHSLFLYAAIRCLYLGSTLVLTANNRPDHFMNLTKETATTCLYATPVQVRNLLDQVKLKKIQLPDMRKILTSGAKFPLQWLKECHRYFPNTVLFEFYGTSELSFISAKKLSLSDNPHHVGRPFDGVTVKIEPFNHSKALTNEKSDQQSGKIYIDSKFSFLGYATTATKSNLEQCDIKYDALSIGDIGYLDKNNELYLQGRIDRMFISNGRNIYPEEIETALTKHPKIKYCAIFSSPHKIKENIIVAVLYLNQQSEPITRAELSQYCRESFPLYNLPKNYYIIDDWPKTVSDKTDLKKIESLLTQKKLKKLL